jgi:hypothetical protein
LEAGAGASSRDGAAGAAEGMRASCAISFRASITAEAMD